MHNGSVNVKCTIMRAGHCEQYKALANKTQRWSRTQFHALFALIQHPTAGYILFDTGYSPLFYTLTKKLPFALYRWLTPVTITSHTTAAAQLIQQGIQSESISTIIISHFHADHIGGLQDFPLARIICMRSAYEEIQHLNGIAALTHGLLRGLLPLDFATRISFVEEYNHADISQQYSPLTHGYDIFNDGSLLAIPLPGHSQGHLGLLVTTDTQPLLFVGDACWTSAAFSHKQLPHWLSFLIHHNKKAYKQTVHMLATLHTNYPTLKIIPSHCASLWHTKE